MCRQRPVLCIWWSILAPEDPTNGFDQRLTPPMILSPSICSLYTIPRVARSPQIRRYSRKVGDLTEVTAGLPNSVFQTRQSNTPEDWPLRNNTAWMSRLLLSPFPWNAGLKGPSRRDWKNDLWGRYHAKAHRSIEMHMANLIFLTGWWRNRQSCG